MKLLKNIIVGIDSSKSSLNVLKRAFLLAEDKNTDIIESYFNASNGILEYVVSNKNDFAVLSSKGKSNISKFILGSTTSSLLENLKTDLLIYSSEN